MIDPSRCVHRFTRDRAVDSRPWMAGERAVT
jgi:hypothetical protein